MEDAETGPVSPGGPLKASNDAGQTLREWVRANFTQIFGGSIEGLRAQGIDPRQYARDHRDKIREFAQMQRRRGISIPSGNRPNEDRAHNHAPRRRDALRGDGYDARRGPGIGMWGGTAWIGILVALLALRFLLVDSFVGSHAAIFWVLEIAGIVLVARVMLFSWLRNRRFKQRQSKNR